MNETDWTPAEAVEKIEELKHWIRTFIVKEFPELDNLPVCPYAPPALENDTVRIKVVNDNLLEKLKEYVDNWTDRDDRGNVEVLAVITPTDRYTVEEYQDISEKINEYAYEHKGIIRYFYPVETLEKILNENFNIVSMEHDSHKNLDSSVSVWWKILLEK